MGLGRKAGEKLYAREDSRFFKRKHLDKTREFYEKHGGKTIILARFIPIVRTYAPFVAGASRMDYPRFLSFNVIGGVAWITLVGMWSGSAITDRLLDARPELPAP